MTVVTYRIYHQVVSPTAPVNGSPTAIVSGITARPPCPTPNTIDTKKTLIILSIDGNLDESVWSINGQGFDIKEAQIFSGKALDIMVTYGIKHYVEELKLWQGAKAYDKGPR